MCSSGIAVMMGDGVIDIPRIRGWVEAAGYRGFNEIKIFPVCNWRQRDPEEVVENCIDRYAELASGKDTTALRGLQKSLSIMAGGGRCPLTERPPISVRTTIRSAPASWMSPNWVEPDIFSHTVECWMAHIHKVHAQGDNMVRNQRTDLPGKPLSTSFDGRRGRRIGQVQPAWTHVGHNRPGGVHRFDFDGRYSTSTGEGYRGLIMVVIDLRIREKASWSKSAVGGSPSASGKPAARNTVSG